jgi:hypothetical protein
LETVTKKKNQQFCYKFVVNFLEVLANRNRNLTTAITVNLVVKFLGIHCKFLGI